tara:strand:+ start:44 stop:700 length:657 start_codon:yes stop_codon:yes gene_type:complete
MKDSIHKHVKKPKKEVSEESIKEDLTLVSNIKNEIDVEPSINRLIDKHSGIYHQAASRCFAKGQLMNDFFEEKQLFFYNTAKSYKEEKNCKFSVYLYNATRWASMKILDKATKREDPYDPQDLDSLRGGEINETTSSDDLIFKEEFGIIEDLIDKMEDEKSKKIIRMRYIDGDEKRPTSFTKIKDQVGLTRWGAVMAHDRGMLKLKKHIEKMENNIWT